MDVDELLAREELRDIHYTYCYCIDTLDVDRFVDLFAEDGRLVVPSYEDDIVGHDGLRQFMADRVEEERTFTAHMPATPRIQVDGDTASAQWYVFVMVQYDAENLIWGLSTQEAEYERIDGEWKIKKQIAARQHTLDFSSFIR